jgi:hypothetical protein
MAFTFQYFFYLFSLFQLANAVSDGDTKKLTKAETLKAAILYIHHLEQILNKPMTAGAAGDENAPSPMEMKPPIW